MTRVTFIDGLPNVPLDVNSHIGFVVNGGTKGWVQRLEYDSDGWRILSLDDGAIGNGYGGRLNHFPHVLSWLSGGASVVYCFPDTKSLLRWLGSNQPI